MFLSLCCSFSRDLREEHFFFYWVQISPGIFFFPSRKIAESRKRDGSCVEYADVFIHSFTKYLLSTYCVLGTVLRAGSSSGEREGQFLPFIVIIFLCVGETVDVQIQTLMSSEESREREKKRVIRLKYG